MTLVTADNVIVDRGGERVLDVVRFEVEPGEFVGVVGPNGSGKTTLLRTLCGLQPLTTGRVTVDGRAVADLPHTERARVVGYLPQGAAFHWPVSVGAAVTLGRYPHRDSLFGVRDTDTQTIASAMAATGVTRFAARSVDTLSGGERMRVHLARLLAGQHRLVVADEPITSLDPAYQLQFLTVLQRLKSTPTGIVISLHDLNLAMRFCDRIVVLDRGRIASEGTPREALSVDVLRKVFRVDVEIIETDHGPCIVPVRNR